MKKGQETGLTIVISTVVLILIITQFFIFEVFFGKEVKVDTKEVDNAETNFDLLNLVNLNSDLIVKSLKDDNYSTLEMEIDKLNIEGCWELKINEKILNEEKCKMESSSSRAMIIPDYEGNQIKITLKVGKK